MAEQYPYGRTRKDVLEGMDGIRMSVWSRLRCRSKSIVELLSEIGSGSRILRSHELLYRLLVHRGWRKVSTSTDWAASRVFFGLNS